MVLVRWSAPMLAFLFLVAARPAGESPELALAVGQLQSVASTGSTHTIPFFPSASDPLRRQGFARIVNRSGTSGTLTIDAFDDSGRNHGPVTLTLDARETAHFNSADLEDGNAAKGLATGTGRPSEGDWRLELTSDLDIMVLSYIRTSDGFVTAMHDVAPAEDGNSYAVAFFNPGSNTAQVSMLRLVNAGDASASVTIRGVDDLGVRAGPVRLSVPARAARTLSAADMEAGAAGLTGALGDGSGKWRLEVEADRPIMALSLLATPTGHLTNLSTASELVAARSDTDPPPAPTVEVTGAREFKITWMWSGEAGETYAFDGQARLDGGRWSDFCDTLTWDSGSDAVVLTITSRNDLRAGTVIEARFRYRNAPSCDAGSPGPWSHVGQATVPGGGGTGGGGTDDHGDTFGAATPVSVPSTTTGELEEGGDRDYFRLVLDAAATLAVETTGGTDTYGTLFDGNEATLERNDDGGAGRNFSITRAVQAGTYYVEVRGFGSSTTGSYALVVGEADNGGGGSGTRYEVGDTVANMPSGSWFPSIFGGGSFSLSGGSWTLTLNENAYARQGNYRWTCRSSLGCRVEDRVVRRGTIVETTE